MQSKHHATKHSIRKQEQYSHWTCRRMVPFPRAQMEYRILWQTGTPCIWRLGFCPVYFTAAEMSLLPLRLFLLLRRKTSISNKSREERSCCNYAFICNIGGCSTVKFPIHTEATISIFSGPYLHSGVLKMTPLNCTLCDITKCVCAHGPLLNRFH